MRSVSLFSLSLLIILVVVFGCALEPNPAVAAETYRSYATQDAWVSSLFPDTNYGGATNLFGFYKISDDTSGRIFFKFDLSPIPSNATVSSAYVSLFELGDGQSCYGQPGGNFYMSQLTSDWGESTLTWNNQPGKAANAASLFECTTGYKAISFNYIAQQMVSGNMQNYGFVLHGLLFTESWMRTVRSREVGESYAPKVTITYTLPSPTPAPAPTPDPVDPSGPTSTTTSGTAQTGITTGTKAAPAAKTSSVIKSPTQLLLADVANETRAAIKLNWKISESTNIDGYKIFRSEQEKEGFTNVALAEKGIVEFVDETVESGKNYYYFLRSYKGETESESTPTISMVSSLLVQQAAVAGTKSNQITDKELYLLLGAGTLLLIAFLLFYELNWKKKLTVKKV